MATVKYEFNCNLCGQPVEIDGFLLETKQGLKRFCCAGCQSIFRLLYLQDDNANSAPTKTTKREEN